MNATKRNRVVPQRGMGSDYRRDSEWFFQVQKLEPQMTQISQMGADPTRMGPPEAASGPAGGHCGAPPPPRGGGGGAPRGGAGGGGGGGAGPPEKGRAPAPPAEAHAREATI